ncbi:hypothetical protein [Luteococcus peritonei]|uniref:Uncharacterized protein n=1 Tax=Luteococcus peritonei TaxID=88874 RepID=A0ABW4RX27_9ACTN
MLDDAASVELLHAVAALAPRAALMRSIPGTAAHALALAAGATVFERIPAARIDPAHPEVRRWIDQHAEPSRAASDYSMTALVDLWVQCYVSSHQHFGLVADLDLLRSKLGHFVEKNVDANLTRVVEMDGRPIAAACVFRVGGALMGLVDALHTDDPAARLHVATAMAAMLRSVPAEPIELDGHASGAHYPAVLATIPHVTAGDLTPMELLRLEPCPTETSGATVQP